MNDLSTQNNDYSPANRPDTATYMKLFEDDQTRCAPGALMANNGRLAYLVHLREMIQAFEVRADVSAPITLQQRRSDLLDLKLDEKNTRKVLPKIRMVLDVLESRARQVLPERKTLQQAVANGLYQANVPFHHAWESIKATLATKQLHVWDVLRSTHASYPAFTFDNLTLADQRAATVLSSGFSPQLRALLLAPSLPAANLMPDVTEENQRQEAEFYQHHFHISDSRPLNKLNTTQKLTKALGLTRRELRKLLAVNAIGEGNTSVTRSALVTTLSVASPSSQVFGAAFINNGTTPLYLTELTPGAPQASTPEETAQATSSDTPAATSETSEAPAQANPSAPLQQSAQPPVRKPAKKTVAITGLTSAHLDRLQRILRIQRALDLTAAEADALVMAALRAEGQAGDYHLTANTLRALGMFRHLQQKYRVTPWQYAAFLDVIAPYAADQQVSFYDKLFAPANSDEDADEKPLQLDDQPFDYQASAGADAQTLNQLAVAMKVNSEVLRVVLEWVCKAQGLNKPTRSLAVISACYRIVTLLRLFDSPIAEGMLILTLLTQEQPAYLQQLAGRPCLRDTLDEPDIIDVIAGLMNTLEWLQGQGLETMQVFALLNHQQPVFQKDWEIAFEAGTFKPDPQLSPEPDKTISDTPAEGETGPGQLDEVAQRAATPSQKAAGATKKAPPSKTKEQRVEACYKALSQPLRKALKLEAGNWVEPLLSWAGVDPEALYQRMLQVQVQLNADLPLKPLKEILLLSDLWTWTLLQRYSDLIKLFKLNASALEQIAHQPTWFNLDAPHHATVINEGELLQLDVRTLDFTTLYQLGRYKALLARLAKGKSEEGVLAYLKQANDKDAATDAKATWAELEALLGLPATRPSALNLDSPPKTLRDLDRLLRLQGLADKHQLSLDTLLDLGKLPLAQDHADFTRVETALRQGRSSKQRKAHEAQLSVAWRDALMQWMLVHWVPGSTAPNWIDSPQTLADYLLIDLQVSHEPLTTRTLSATASLQRYLHQIHSHLENGYRDVTIGEEEREEWENFSSSYERWELRKSAHNEPQNYIDPTRRTRKTNAFKDLENLLAQGKCTPDDVKIALETYLSTFEKLSNIQPISAYADGTSPLSDTYHFIGKTNVEPVEYYWRTLDMSLRDQDGAPSMLAWGEWEKITLGITGKLAVTPLPKEAPLLYVKGNETEEAEKAKEDAAKAAKQHEDERLAEDLRTHIELIRPVIIAGRRYAVWAEWGATAIPMGPDNKASDYYPLRVCFAYQQTDGAWSAPNELLLLDGHDEKGNFDPKIEQSVTTEDEKTKKKTVVTHVHGTAPSNVFLKTKDFQPGLMVMVNQMGGREHDPWFMVMLYDTVMAKSKRRNIDYFLVAKDLLLIESQVLDSSNTASRPIEEKMISNWLDFFHDPRTVQHPYMGAATTLKETLKDDKLSRHLPTQTALKYSRTKSGEVLLAKPAPPINGTINLKYNLNGEWKTRNGHQTFEPVTLVHGFIKETGSAKITIIETFDINTEVKKIQEAFKQALENLECLKRAHTDTDTEINETINEAINKAKNKKSKIHLLHYTAETPNEFIVTNITVSDLASDVQKADISGLAIYIPDIENLITLNIKTALLNPKNYTYDIYDSTVTKLEHKPSPSRHGKFSARLTATVVAPPNPNWTLSTHDHALLNTPEHQILKRLSEEPETKETFTKIKQSLLKVRYTTTKELHHKMGYALKGAPSSRLSVHKAIITARAKNRQDVVNFYLKLEEDAILKEIGTLPDGINLDAALRLRHFHPDACSRILLHIDPDHQMIFEDELITDGIDQLNFHCPINLDFPHYRFKLDLYDGTDHLGSLTHTYELVDTPDDAVPTVQLRRNDEQALYLDLKEVNAKLDTGQTRLPESLRLNTLFGKQLVALATQSVQRALSWEAQCLPEPRLEPGGFASTVDFHSANGLYFWELFFHAPFLVAWLKRQNRDYGVAWRSSTRHLFDPYRTWVPDGNHPPLFWLTQPILGKPAVAATDKTSDPDELAYADPERYKKALHLFVVENWQRQGDDFYRQLNLDTLVEAALCYDKALRLIGVLPENLSTAPVQAKSLAESATADFTPPLNNKLVELRNLLRNRLFNLRHGLTLDGKPAAIMLDPATLDQIALGYGGANQEHGRTARIARTVPPCRYEEARKCAGEAVLQLIELGQTQLRFYDRDASLQLSLANKANIIKLMDYPCRLQAQALELAKRERETVLASKRMVQDRQSYYQGLVDEGITDLEHAAQAFAYMSRAAVATSAIFASSSKIIEATVPTIYGLAFGGNSPAQGVAQAVVAFDMMSSICDMTKDELRLQADYQLRSQQWQFEADQASFELQLLDQQLLEHDVRIKAASIAVEEARATQAAHRAEYEIMTSVFSNHATYLWLIGRMSQIYSSAYDATLSLCLMAEACLQFELGDFSSTWIKTDGWLDNWRGMLAGEALERDLMRMDVAAIRDNHRPLDIRKDLSLLDCMQWTHEDLHAQLDSDKVAFTLSPWLFDRDYPGHYLRRLERIVLSFKLDGASSSAPVPAMLVQTSNRLLLDADSEGARHLYNANEGSAANVLRDLRPQQNMAVWSVNEFNRTLDLLPLTSDKSRYQPFEGTGLISTWVLSFPGGAKNNPLLYRDGEWLLEDINVQLNYSAVDGTPAFRENVKRCLTAFDAANREADADYQARAAASKRQFAARSASRKELMKALKALHEADTKARVAAESLNAIEARAKPLADGHVNATANLVTAETELKTAQTKAAEEGLSAAQKLAAKEALVAAQAEVDAAKAAIVPAEAALNVLNKAKKNADNTAREAAEAKLTVEALQARNAEVVAQALNTTKTLASSQVTTALETLRTLREAINVQAAKPGIKAPEAQAHFTVIEQSIATLKTAHATVERAPTEIEQATTIAETNGVLANLRKAVDSAVKAKRDADEAVARAVSEADEAEAKRITDEAEAKRKADEAEAKRIA
ncbi:Tc toxin subunit A, partial [Pseudomonas entomophila]|uniref:Tc toxin subunit A-related protein n=1 Tax=Pseudomonas entomophila TaxID=312306 RepID=UPI002405FDD0